MKVGGVRESIVEYDVTEKKVEYYGREEGPRQAHLIRVEVKSSHSLLAEVVVWQHPIHCLREDLCVCVRLGEGGERGRGRGRGRGGGRSGGRQEGWGL